LEQPLSGKEALQIARALRSVGDREVVFARAVILVEDESLQQFLRSVAPRLGYDLDAHSVSVVFTGGHGGHRPFHTLLESLGIPHIDLRDKPWGENTKFPPDRFFSLGMEFEEFIDQCGLGSLRSGLIEELGTAKPRIADALGSAIDEDKVPTVFGEVLSAAVSLAIGEPVTT